MSELTTARELRLLTADEKDFVLKSHQPVLAGLDRAAARDLLGHSRRLRDRYRDLADQQRREARGKAKPKSSRAATDNTNTRVKQRIFAHVIKRVNKHIARLDALEARNTTETGMKRALKLRRQAEAGADGMPTSRTKGRGMKARPNAKGPSFPDNPRQRGQHVASQQRAQAKRDSKG